MSVDVARGAQALLRAVEADDELWEHPRSGVAHQRARDVAVAQAVAGGISMEKVADDLGVRIGDVERMIRSAES